MLLSVSGFLSQQNWLHQGATNCRRACAQCSYAEHDDSTCTKAEKCINCKGSHLLKFRECPVYKEEQTLLRKVLKKKYYFLWLAKYKESLKLRNFIMPGVSFVHALSSNGQ